MKIADTVAAIFSIFCFLLAGYCFLPEDTPISNVPTLLLKDVKEGTVQENNEVAATSENHEIADVADLIISSISLPNSSVSYGESYIIIDWYYDGAAAVVTAADSDREKAKTWDHFIDSQKDLAETAKKLLKQAGLNDVSFSLNLLDDTNKSIKLLSIVDGEVVFNAGKR